MVEVKSYNLGFTTERELKSPTIKWAALRIAEYGRQSVPPHYEIIISGICLLRFTSSARLW